MRFFWLLVLISPSCLAASGEKAKKSCSVCAYKFAVADPHPTCLKHNTTCFRHFEFIPEGCIHCSYLIKKFKEGEKKQQAVFLARIDAMQHKISYLAKTNPDKLPERVKNASLLGTKIPLPPICATLTLDPGPLAPSLASEAPRLFRPNHPRSKPPEQNQTLLPLRSLRPASTCSRTAPTPLPSRGSSPAEPPLTTNSVQSPHVTDSKKTNTVTTFLGPPPLNLLVRCLAGQCLLDPTAAPGPIALDPALPAGPHPWTPAVGALPDPPAGTRYAL